MELIDRYLQAVKLALPKNQQTDVVRELSDEILSQVEEKEAALGRPLTEDEQVALVQQLGHPALVASRYRKQQYLIGPALFPIYWFVLKLVLALTLFGMAIASITLAATGKGLGSALGAIGQFPSAAIYTFAWITAVFAVADFFQAKFNFFANWNARTLPKLSKHDRRPSTFDSAAGLFFGAIFGAWWLVGLKHQFLIFGPGIAYVRLSEVWQTLYPVFLVMIVADIVRHMLALVRPGWENAQLAFRFFSRAMNLLVLYFLYNAQELLVFTNAHGPQAQSQLQNLNRALHLCVALGAALAVLQLAWDIYKYFRRDSNNGAPAAAAL